MSPRRQCTCMKMEPFVLLAFSPSFITFFASKLDISPLENVVLLKCRKGDLGVEKDKW